MPSAVLRAAPVPATDATRHVPAWREACDRLAGGASEGAALSPEQLATRCQAGCREAFAELVERFQERLYNFLLRLTHDPHEAEDLAQETFLRAYRGMHRFRGSCSFSTWLFTIGKRAAFTYLRRRRHFEELPAEDETVSDQADPAAEAAQHEQRASLWALARRLKPKQYEALWLRYAEGLSVAETAHVMGTNALHVRVLLHRGRGQLAQHLQAAARRDGPPRC